jgi:hypothetical protein
MEITLLAILFNSPLRFYPPLPYLHPLTIAMDGTQGLLRKRVYLLSMERKQVYHINGLLDKNLLKTGLRRQQGHP